MSRNSVDDVVIFIESEMIGMRYLAEALSEGRRYLLEHESKGILDDWGLKTTGAYLARSEDEAADLARSVGYPVVLKVLSTQVVHKSDQGGVRLNLRDEPEVRKAYGEIAEAFRGSGLVGVSVQKMAAPGIEVIVGVTRDPTFGPMLMFGLGGIFVEVMKDVSFRSIPITLQDASDMVREIKGYPIIRGIRGISGDEEALQDLLMRVSALVEANLEIEEMDLNPVFLYQQGYTIVDARIMLGSAPRSPSAHKPAEGLRTLFYPRSVAVLGASNVKGKLGWNVFHNLLSHGFAGRLYPVNPRSAEVQGVKSYPSIKEVPVKVDVAIVLVPATATPQAIRDCCEAGIKYIIVESAGFAELGESGKKIEREMLSIAEAGGCRLLGPNCSGIINTHAGVVESIGVVDDLDPGKIGLIAQAGVYAAGYLWGMRRMVDFGAVATIGNKLDVNETDILETLGADDNIQVICMYIEDVKAGRRFLDVASRITPKKPVIVLKAGRTEAGIKAVSSHTASLAGNDQIYSAVFRQAGMIRARDNDHMFDLARAFASQPLPKGQGVFIVTYAGSLGVAAADGVSAGGMRLSELSGDLKERLIKILPAYVGGLNPVDYTFDQSPEQVKKTVEIGVESDDVGAFIVVLQTEILGTFFEALKSIDFRGKPVVAVAACKEFVLEDVIRFEKAKIPVYSTSERAAEVLAAMYHYSLWQKRAGR
ncbi:MAG: succinyl-CoA synthetase subunit alpha [Methanosaeta sp. PtaB.Bin039]|nr:MAG: succinyl-CoA synthetase subunit alpha [Methanosaeta sp. PtaB.Bin039]